ncbi:GlxA family transcriptional regulator [Streptomyces sp. NPDC048514]|uniref:GlxA family transcriptional regulator n=1 Tax=Streptomyces sp. NPDC048514 TaxID=3365564 RepID=UPI00371AE7B5
MDQIRRLVVIVLFEDVDLLDVTGPPEVFALLRREMDGDPGYQVALAAETLDPVTTSAGVRVLPDLTFEDAARHRIDTLLVPGSVEVDHRRQVHALVDPRVVARIKQLAGQSRRIASVCVGAHLLAAAGLLDGKRATTHWSTAQQLAADHPAVEVDPDPIFIRQGDVWTGAGLTACLDLSLALVSEDFGEAAALAVARQLVMYLKRPSGQSQFSVPLETGSTSRRMDALRLHISQNLTRPLSVAELATHSSIGERHLNRLFRDELGTTPGAYVESVRLEAARSRLETTDDTLDRVAGLCGFKTTDTLIRVFRRRLNTTPTEYRNRFRRTVSL